MFGSFDCILGSVRGVWFVWLYSWFCAWRNVGDGFISSLLRKWCHAGSNPGHMHGAMATTSSATRSLMRLNYESSPIVGFGCIGCILAVRGATLERGSLIAFEGKNMVPRGLEPRTLRLLAVRSNQLSYETSEHHAW